VSDVGEAEIEKSGLGFTVRLMVTEWVFPPPVPVTVSV